MPRRVSVHKPRLHVLAVGNGTAAVALSMPCTSRLGVHIGQVVGVFPMSVLAQRLNDQRGDRVTIPVLDGYAALVTSGELQCLDGGVEGHVAPP